MIDPISYLRCECGHYIAMPTNRELLCCCEIDKLVDKKGENEKCIIDHDGFEPVCLILWVIQVAFSTYRHRYDEAEEKEPHQYDI